MDNLLKKRVLYFRDLLAEYPGCTNPVITVKALSGVDIACIIGGAVHFFTTPDHENCLEAFITCDDCYQSAPLRIVKCFCDDNEKCPTCQFCDPNFVCQPKCPDQPCVNDQCVACNEDYPCKNGEVCTNGKCNCPTGWLKDTMGICRECLSDGNCEGCDVCYGFQCVPKTCSTGARVNPKTCACVECYDSSQCTEPHTCCQADGTCACCPGYYRDPVTGNCEKYPACVAGECPPCMDCIDKECKPVSCPAGHLHVGSECCLQVCDCSNPSCPPGYSCWPVPGQNICVCRSCNVPCSMGVCPEWCNCSGANCVPKSKKCYGYCDENTPCPNGCGCNLTTHECEDCTNKSCTNNDCGNLIGCKCDHQGTSVGTLCIADPCNSPCTKPSDCGNGCGCNTDISRCEPCDRPCDNNLDCQFGCYCDKGTKRCKKNPCPDNCQSGGDCGPGCGCWEDKGCYPCDSFDCLNCENVDGCKCSDGVNCAEKKTDCPDKLEIISDDANCALIGRLETNACCSCPEIGYQVTASLTNLGVFSMEAKLRKGYTLSSPLLDMTGIANDFPPISGKVMMDVFATYLDGSTVIVTEDLEANWGGAAINSILNDLIAPIACATTPASNTLQKVTITFTTEVNFTFPNGCVFRIPAGTKVNIDGCGKTADVVIPMTRVSGCKKPLFTWKKDSVIFRKAYAQPTAPGSNIYKDTVTNVDGAEVCHNYTLDSDCGCDRTTAYSCYGDETRPTLWTPCNPQDMTITVIPNTCNRDITIAALNTCAAYEGQTFSLYVNDVLYTTSTVVGGVIFPMFAINYPDPITKVELRFPCDTCSKCTIIKNLTSTNPCGCAGTPLAVNITGTPTCEGGMTFQITGGEPTYKVVLVRVVNGIEHEDESFQYTTPAPITQAITGPMDPGTYTIKVIDRFGCEARDTRTLNCCNLGNMSTSYDCDNQKIVINRSTTFALEYNIGAGWFALNANNKIAIVLANGSYPNYVQLRKLGEPTCNTTLDLEVDCDTCALTISSAALNGTCDVVTLTASGAYDQYSLNNNTSWVAGTSPISLPSALTNGQTVRVYIRNSADPSCMDSIDLRCAECATYAIGTGVIDYDCVTGNLSLVGFTAPPVPAFCNGGILYFKYRLNGSAWTTVNQNISFWSANMLIATSVGIGLGVTNIEVEVELKCPNSSRNCELVTLTEAIVNTDTLLNVTYNCDDPNKGLQWSGTPIGPVQVNIDGVWTTVTQGFIIASPGSKLIRDFGAGAFCAATKTFTVPNCGGGGGGGGSTECDIAAGLLQVSDNCSGTVTVTNGYGAAVNVTLQIRDNNLGTCTGSIIYTVVKNNLAPGASHSFTSVPISNGTKTFAVQVPTAGDPCVSCKVGNICTGGTCSLTDDPVLQCVNAGSKIQIRVTNNNSVEVAVYVDNIYRVNMGAGASTTLPQKLATGNHTVKFVCLSDVTVFRSKTQNFNC
jgi:hypothetical protein